MKKRSVMDMEMKNGIDLDESEIIILSDRMMWNDLENGNGMD